MCSCGWETLGQRSPVVNGGRAQGVGGHGLKWLVTWTVAGGAPVGSAGVLGTLRTSAAVVVVVVGVGVVWVWRAQIVVTAAAACQGRLVASEQGTLRTWALVVFALGRPLRLLRVGLSIRKLHCSPTRGRGQLCVSDVCLCDEG